MIKIGSKQRLESIMQLGILSSIPEALNTAFALKIFDILSPTRQTLGELNSSLQFHEDSLERLLDLLSALKVVRKNGRYYRNYKHLEKYLQSTSSEYIGDLFAHQQATRLNWGKLPEIVKTGRKEDAASKSAEEVAFFQRGMRAKNVFFAEKVVAQLELKGESKLLELCAGPGSFTCELLKQHPEVEVTVLDLPQTIPVTREMVETALEKYPEKESMLKRLVYEASDIFEYPFPSASFDAVFFADAMHIWGEEKNLCLFQKVYQSLRNRGEFFIYDFYINEKETGPLSSLIFHNHMNVMTDRGKVYTYTEIKKLLHKAGFSAVRFQRTERSDHILVTAKKVD